MTKTIRFKSPLAEWMLRHDKSGEDVAEMTGLHPSIVSRAKNGKRISREVEDRIKALIAEPKRGRK